MKRYLLSYLAAYLVSLAVTGIMVLWWISQWLFTDSPLWFDVLFGLMSALTILAMGELLGRRPKAKAVRNPVRGLLLLLVVMEILALLSALSDYFLILSWPGWALGYGLLNRVSLFDSAYHLIGNLLVPCLFHLGWHWGTASRA